MAHRFGIFLFTGRLTDSFDEDDNFTFDRLSGRAVNVCGALA